MQNAIFGKLDPVMTTRADGSMLVSVTAVMPAHKPVLTDYLDHWAVAAPDRTFLAERDAGGAWRTVSYAQARDDVHRLAAGLLQHGLSPVRPLAILSGNDINHALIALAAMSIGVPYVPVSTAYSLVSQDHGKLKYVFELLTPGLVYVADGATFAGALKSVASSDAIIVAGANASAIGAIDMMSFGQSGHSADVAIARRGVGSDTIAKFLLTSGSTGNPKAVINTQRMLTSNQAMLQQAFPFLLAEPPVLVDWLPWNHTFGSNHNIGLVLVNGGTLHIDAGKPMPGAINTTVKNLKEIAPTAYFNVPRGYEALLPNLEADDAFATHFFSRLKILFYAGAALSPVSWNGYQRLAQKVTGKKIPFVTGLGATETAPSALMNMRDVDEPGHVGQPMAGVTIKLVPNSGKLEVRVKGDNITPGYWRSPELTKAAFDNEGFYCMGDALKFATPGDPNGGFIFDGRVAEDFKLATGTWVSVGPLRSQFLAAFAPLAKDVVIAGQDRDDIIALILPDSDGLRALAGIEGNDATLAAHPIVIAAFKERLAAFAKASTGSSNRIRKLAILIDPPSIDKGEITDKGSINQRAVLTHRKALVDALYAGAHVPHAIAL